MPLTLLRRSPAAVVATGVIALAGLPAVAQADPAGTRSYAPLFSPASITTVGVAGDGTVWTGTGFYDALLRLNPATDRLDAYNPGPGTAAGSLDISPAGHVWRIRDLGRIIDRYDNASPSTSARHTLASGVRAVDLVWHGDKAWVSTNEGLVRRGAGATTTGVRPDPGAPRCDGAIGVGGDQQVWCVAGDRLLRVSGAARSVTVPGQAGRDISSVAAGPRGQVWFTRHRVDARGLPDGGGQLGRLDPSTGRIRFTDLGAGSEPTGLTVGGAGRRWFVDGGTRPALYLLNADGRGGALDLPDRRPHDVAEAPDGTVWLTDTRQNQLLRLPAAGARAVDRALVLDPPRPAKVLGKKSRLGARKATVRFRCQAAVPCRVTVRVTAPGGARWSRTQQVSLASGATRTVRVRLNSQGRRAVRRAEHAHRQKIRVRVVQRYIGGVRRSTHRFRLR